MVHEILEDQPDVCLEILYPPDWPRPHAAPGTVSHFILDGALFKTLDLFGTRAPLLVCQTPAIHTWNPESSPQGIELLCPLGDPSNVGAVLRTCHAFGVQNVILLKESASPFHPKSVRSASGALFQITFFQGPSIDDLHQATTGSAIVALEVQGNCLSTFQWPRDVRLLIGEEGKGLPAQQFPQYLSIPMVKGMHSLNAAVAASIGMYAYRLQHPW